MKTMTVMGVALTMGVASGAAAQDPSRAAFGSGFEASRVAPMWTAYGRLAVREGGDSVCYEVTPMAGQRYTLDLTSDSFDAILEAGAGRGCNWTDRLSDDDSGDGSNARLSITGDGRPWSVRARSYGGGAGSYALMVKWDGAVGAGGGAQGIRLGQTIRGEWATSDASESGAYYDCYRFTASGARSVTAELTPGEGMAVLKVFAGGACQGQDIANALAMTKATVTVSLPTAGDYSILAHRMAIGRTGAYTLSLR